MNKKKRRRRADERRGATNVECITMKTKKQQHRMNSKICVSKWMMRWILTGHTKYSHSFSVHYKYIQKKSIKAATKCNNV